AFPMARALELAGTFRDGFFAALAADLPALRAVLAVFLAVLPETAARFRAGLAALAAAALALFLAALASTAPIAARMRLISRVTCSMVIMPSTVSSLRRSE